MCEFLAYVAFNKATKGQTRKTWNGENTRTHARTHTHTQTQRLVYVKICKAAHDFTNKQNDAETEREKEEWRADLVWQRGGSAFWPHTEWVPGRVARWTPALSCSWKHTNPTNHKASLGWRVGSVVKVLDWRSKGRGFESRQEHKEFFRVKNKYN